MDDIMQLQDLRRRVLNKEEVTAEQYAIVIESLREGRKASATTKKKAAPKEKKPSTIPDNLDDLFLSK